MDSEVMDVRLQSWIPVLKAQAESGLNKREFCEKHGIPENSFYKWQRNVRKKLLTDGADMQSLFDTSEGNGQGAFVELPMLQPVQQPSCSPEVVAPQKPSSMTLSFHGVSIKLDGSVDEAALSSVLRAVKHA